jgi:hypothetical protein
MRVIIHPALPNPPALPIPAGHPPGQATSTAPFRRISLIPEEATLGQIRAFLTSRSETARGEFTLPMLTGVLRVRRL